MKNTFSTVQQAKEQAKRLRAQLVASGTVIGHGQSLEVLAQQRGFRDWNTMHAAIETRSLHPWAAGDRVQGTYLAQPFTAVVISAQEQDPGWTRVHLELDAAVDVVTSDHFSNYRKRIRGTVGPKGYSAERTSNGQPQLQIEL